MTDWLIDFYRTKQFGPCYSDFTYGTALGGSTRLFAALRRLTTTYFDARIPVEREHVIAGSGARLVPSCDPRDLTPRPVRRLRLRD